MKTSRITDKAQRQADAFNAAYPVGTLVKYSAIKGQQSEHDVIGRTRSKAWLICDDAVVLIEGKSGGVSLDHVTIWNHVPKPK